MLGILVGPKGLGLINDAQHIEQLAHIGIILPLFLIGLLSKKEFGVIEKLYLCDIDVNNYCDTGVF